MFVQSHIQRHHHHNHHHQAHTNPHNQHPHNQHPHQHPHHNHQHQHHSLTNHQHHSAKHTSTANQKRAIRAGSATVGLAYATLEQVSCVTANVLGGGGSGSQLDKHVNHSSQIPAHETCEIDFISKNKSQLRGLSVTTSAAQHHTKSDTLSSAQIVQQKIVHGQASSEIHRAATEEVKGAIRRREQSSSSSSLHRYRTRSLGSHESLRVYDFMPRNGRLASVEVAPSITTTTTTSTRRNQTTTDQSTQIRLTQICASSSIEESETYRSRVRRLDLQESTCKPRRAFSDTSSDSDNSLRGGLRSLFAHSRQLIGVILDAPWTLASGFASWTLLKPRSDEQPTGGTSALIVRRQPSVELIRSFCMSFVTYQCETWRLLARDLARENQQTTRISSGPVRENAQSRRGNLVGAAYGGCAPRGQRFYSLDRPVLSRQREVVLDDETPVIKIPPIYREPSPVPLIESVVSSSQDYSPSAAMFAAAAATQNHHRSTHHNHHQQQHHRHSHRHVPPPMESSTAAINFEQRDNVTTASANGQLFHQQEVSSTITRQEFKERARFYLGQQSLDCDFMQSARRTIHEQEYDDGSWSDRPLKEEDFKSEANSKCNSMVNGDCDQYDLQKNQSNLLTESRASSRKQRSLKKSTSPLSFEGARRRLGLKRKDETNQLSSISVNRSEEVIPTEVKHLSRQTTFNSLYDSGTESGTFWRATSQLSSDPRSNFVEGIGVGQIASRQALVSPYLGDIQLSLSSRRGMLEVEVIRARGLHAKPGTKSLPSPYVKVYLMKAKKCIAKCRTRQANQTLDPLYQEPFVFRNEFKNCVLQVIVWGDYGKRDRKSMMGIVQIHLDDLDISNMVIGWYKLFNIPSMTNSLASSKILRQRLVHSTSISTRYTPINI